MSEIEYIGPKRLVIVRVPENYDEDARIEMENALSNFDEYRFIVIHQEGIAQIEFEYPKNDCFGCKPSVWSQKVDAEPIKSVLTKEQVESLMKVTMKSGLIDKNL